MVPRGLFIYLAALLFVACKEKKKEAVEGEAVRWELSEINNGHSYRIIKALPFETRENNLLGLNLNVKFNGEGIFVLDEDNMDAVHHFDLSGKYLRPIALVGEGPGNVQNIRDFTLGDSTVIILTGKGDHSAISHFSFDNELLSTLEMGVIGGSFELMENGNYIVYLGYNLPFAQFRLNEITPEGEIVNQILPNDYKNKMLPMMEKNFYKNRGIVYFKESFNPNTYQLSADSLQLNYSADFGKYSIPNKFWELDIMQGFEMINTQGFANIVNYMETEHDAFFSVYVQQQRDVQHIQVVYNKDSGTLSKSTFRKDGNSIFYHPVGFSGEHELLFVAHPAYLKEAVKQEDFDPDLKSLILGLDEEDNPVLLFCKIEQRQ